MGKMFQIIDVSQKCGDVVQHAEKFLPFAQQRMGFNKPVSINFLSDPENAKNPLGKTAYYDPNDMKIVVFVDKRHLKDIMRSLSHELVHHTQNCRGDLEGDNYTGPGYAQKDKHMRKMEGEAYLHGNLCFRDWEDSLKRENSEMNETKLRKYVNNLIKEVLDEADEVEEGKKRKKKSKGKFPDLTGDGKVTRADILKGRGVKLAEEEDLEEVKDVDEINPDSMEETIEEQDKIDRIKGAEQLQPKEKQAKDPVKEAEARVKRAEEKLKNNPNDQGLKDRLESAKEALKRAKKKAGHPTTNENWHKGNKDQLLFERLTKKWTK